MSGDQHRQKQKRPRTMAMVNPNPMMNMMLNPGAMMNPAALTGFNAAMMMNPAAAAQLMQPGVLPVPQDQLVLSQDVDVPMDAEDEEVSGAHPEAIVKGATAQRQLLLLLLTQPALKRVAHHH